MNEGTADVRQDVQMATLVTAGCRVFSEVAH